jgi:hypothetical protein
MVAESKNTENIHRLPRHGYMCLSQILGDPHAKPQPMQPIIPVKKSCWYSGMKSGKFPKPVRVGRFSVWRCADILKLIDRIQNGELGL